MLKGNRKAGLDPTLVSQWVPKDLLFRMLGPLRAKYLGDLGELGQDARNPLSDPIVRWGACWGTSPNKQPKPEGPGTHGLRTLVPKPIRSMVFGARVLEY